jgi:aldehyde dehydrogenase (NAD+)
VSSSSSLWHGVVAEGHERFADVHARSLDDFRKCREETGCIHFMIGRSALANPSLPFQIAQELGINKGAVPQWEWPAILRSLVDYTEECFGPTVNLVEVDGFEQALEAANATPYGLSSAIYTRDASAMLRFKEGISAGMTSINNSTTGAEAHLPFGGNGWSGNGTRESGIWVIDAYTRWQAVNVDLAGKLQKAQIDMADAAAPEPLDWAQLIP